MDIKIPDLGDGIDSATVLSVMISTGDSVAQDDTIIELETDKAVAPVPCPAAGTIGSISIQVGASVSTGTVIGTLVTADGEAVAQSHSEADVGSDSAIPVSQVSTPLPVVSSAQQVSGTVQPYSYTSSTVAEPPASPSIRRFAQLSGLDLGRIQGSGNGGRILWTDVQHYIHFLQATAFNSPSANESAGDSGPVTEVVPKKLAVDFAKYGEVEVQSVPAIRQKISSNLRQTWQVTPHVTQFDDADITDLMALRKKYNPKYEKKGAKLTLTVFAIKAIYNALQQFPQFNASFDEANSELIIKKFCHIGIAVDTENGLMVPVIRDVGQKSLLELALELTEIAQLARDRKITVEQMQGSSFTLSNLGGLGVGPFTPIVNAPDVAILGLGRGQLKPLFDRNKQMTPRLMMPVCMSYDHRVIDGADGARFTRVVIDEFESFSETMLKDGLK